MKNEVQVKVKVEGLDELTKLSQDLEVQMKQISNTIDEINQLKLIVSTKTL